MAFYEIPLETLKKALISNLMTMVKSIAQNEVVMISVHQLELYRNAYLSKIK